MMKKKNSPHPGVQSNDRKLECTIESHQNNLNANDDIEFLLSNICG